MLHFKADGLVKQKTTSITFTTASQEQDSRIKMSTGLPDFKVIKPHFASFYFLFLASQLNLCANCIFAGFMASPHCT